MASRRYTKDDLQAAKMTVARTFARMAQSQRTVGITPAERLSWLEDFSRHALDTDAAADEQGTLLNWFVVAHYAAWGGADFDTATRLQHVINPGDVHVLQRQVRDVLNALEPGGIVWFPQPIVDGIRWSGDRVVSVTRTPGVPQVLAAVADLLADIGPRLRRCETPTCRRLFAFKRPAQRRCRIECGGADRVREWRAKHREQLSEQRHEKYKGQVKAKAPHVRVARRPRTVKGE